MKRCEFCKEKIQSSATKCIHCGEFQTKQNKPFYKKWWFIGLAFLFLIGLFMPDSMKEATNSKNEEVGENLSPKYDLIEKVDNGNLDNYYIIYTNSNDKTIIEKDVKKIKASLCSRKCNIHLFNQNDERNLYKKYPLKGNELIYVADRQIGTLSFTDDFSYYPLQDIKYKEIGGKNYQK